MGYKTRGIDAIALLVVILTSFSALANAQFPNPIDGTKWLTYHGDEKRTGESAVNSLMGGAPSPVQMIWTFPRTDVTAFGDSETVVEMMSGDASDTTTLDGADHTTFVATGPATWQVPYPSAPSDYSGGNLPNGNGVGAGFYWVKVTVGLATHHAFWKPPSTLTRGLYQIEVWFPSTQTTVGSTDTVGKINSGCAMYSVWSGGQQTIIPVDQRQGGRWVPLGNKSFLMDPATDYVELDSYIGLGFNPDTGAPWPEGWTDEQKQNILNRTIVCADAVRFVPGTGLQMYTSPAAGTVAAATYSGPAVWIGTVEQPSSTGCPEAVKDIGALYCVRSDFSPTDPGTAPTDPSKPENQVGSPLWRYPKGGTYDPKATTADPLALAAVALRDPVEGPIGRIGSVGGVYSSPTLVTSTLAPSGTGVVFAGMDGQVYLLDANSGALVWKGPGVTLSETFATGDAWNTIPARPDAFGGTFDWLPVTDSSGAKKKLYTIDTTTSSDPGYDAKGDQIGHMYAIYAWFPGRAPGEAPRTQDALYHITYYKGEDWVRVDQRDPDEVGDLADKVFWDAQSPPTPADQRVARNLPSDPAVGRWVRIGGKYWNPQTIELSSETQMANPDPTLDRSHDALNNIRVVVTDAIMVVPEDLAAFSYSTVTCDAKNVYLGGTNGRVYALQLNPPTNLPNGNNYVGKEHAGHLQWTFPQVQSKNPPDEPTIKKDGSPDYSKTGAGASPIGAIVASPAISTTKSLLVVPCDDGRVYCLGDLNNTDPTVAWVWPKDNNGGVPGEPTDPSTTPASAGSEPFSSSPVIVNDSTVYAASTGGHIYKFALQATASQLQCVYPTIAGLPPSNESGTTTSEPLSPFRFSSPVVTKDPQTGLTWIYIGSTGGQVQGFKEDASGNITQLTDGSTLADGVTVTPFEFANPNFFAPIQGSVALDQNNIYVGTVGTGSGDGSVWWVSRGSGLAADDSGPWDFSGYTDIGTIFSSPAVANNYMYVGSDNGRLYAFSSLAFGGSYVGGRGNGSGPPGRQAISPQAVAIGETPQVDVFSANTYSKSLDAWRNYVQTGGLVDTLSNLLAAWSSAGYNSADMFADNPWAIATDNEAALKGHHRAFPYPDTSSATSPRQLYLEWGEDICLIAWNLPPIAEITGSTITTGTATLNPSSYSSVTFRFVNASAGAGAGGSLDPRPAQYVFPYKDANEKERSCAFAIVENRADKANPPSPGVGWTVTVAVRTRSRTTKSGQTVTNTALPPGVVPLLKNSPGSWEPFTKTTGTVAGSPTGGYTSLQEQPIGINNPLAICDDGVRPSPTGPLPSGNNLGLAWPTAGNQDGTLQGNRDDVTAHFNGNSYLQDMQGDTWADTTPLVYLGWAKHGTNSRLAKVGILDRSAIGLRVTNQLRDPITNDPVGPPIRDDRIKTFRVQPADLAWQGGNSGVYNYLPWDYPPFYSFGTYNSRLQRDYPDIFKRQQQFQKTPDYSNPASQMVELQPAMPSDPLVTDPLATGAFYDRTTRLRPDFMDDWVEVPMFQPANRQFTLDGTDWRNIPAGFVSEAIAYLDNNKNNRFDSGNVIAGKPTTYVETYRRFAVSVDVLPDYHMVIDQPLTIDIMGGDKGMAPHGLLYGVDLADYADWYKQFTVLNLGNVNLYNIKVAKQISNGASTWWLNIPADDVNVLYPIDGLNIVSPLNLDWDPQWGAATAQEPFITRYYGYALSKSRVGEINPMELTIPDARKCQEWAAATSAAIQQVDPAWFASHSGRPAGELPSISVMVPLTQPSGSYHALIPVYADMGDPLYGAGRNDDVLGLGIEPYSDPAFRVNVSVAEDRLTGGSTPGSAVQIDPDPATGAQRNTNGNTQPTAWRDVKDGNVYLFWSSNLPTSGPATSNSPWYLSEAKLPFKGPNLQDPYGWTPPNPNDTPPRWWAPAAPLPAFDWVTPNPTGMQSDTVKYSAPWATIVRDARTDFDTSKVWLFWQGQVDAVATAGKIQREHRIFYTTATKGVVKGDESSIYNLVRDVSQPKMNPKAVAYNPISDSKMENLWLLWHGGDAGRWSIFGNLNISPADSHNKEAWSLDIRFPTPSCLVSVADPCPVQRTIGASVPAVPADSYLDVAYTGASKFDQASDIIMTRYLWSVPGTEIPPKPQLSPVAMPRLYAEEMLKDNKRNVYTSKHLSWIRPLMAAPPPDVLEQIRLETAPLPPASPLFNMGAPPFIHVLFPSGAESGSVHIPAGMMVSATNGMLIDTTVDPPGIVEGEFLLPQMDQATGVYTYDYAKYNLPKLDEALGQMIIECSAGIVRFTKPLPPDAKVFIDYTPQTRRMTRGPEQDGSPHMFIEKTAMQNTPVGSSPNPGLIPAASGANPIDRLWLFWRKQASGVQASTIYYKSYRITVDLTQIIMDPKTGSTYPPVELDKFGTPTSLTTDKALGPCEVSWDGKKLYFDAIDERYPGMPVYPGPIAVTYTPKGGGSGGSDKTVVLDTLTWQEELPEAALRTRQTVNEGQVSAFADPLVRYTKIWVFWSSTRAGQSDVYFQTLSPNFRALY